LAKDSGSIRGQKLKASLEKGGKRIIDRKTKNNMGEEIESQTLKTIACDDGVMVEKASRRYLGRDSLSRAGVGKAKKETNADHNAL